MLYDVCSPLSLSMPCTMFLYNFRCFMWSWSKTLFQDLANAGATKRPTCCVLVQTKPAKGELSQEDQEKLKADYDQVVSEIGEMASSMFWLSTLWFLSLYLFPLYSALVTNLVFNLLKLSCTCFFFSFCVFIHIQVFSILCVTCCRLVVNYCAMDTVAVWQYYSPSI